MLTHPMDRHHTAVLQFSGGKDSLACLYLLQPFWDRVTVMWCNTGDTFPETRQQMQAIAATVPHFVEVRSDAKAQIEQCGWPVDILPVTRSVVGRAIDGHSMQMMQAYTACCGQNIWRPLDAAVRDMGATLIVRGQRTSEKMKSPIRSGAVYDGIEYWFPIEDWSEEDVFSYLRREKIPVPANYDHTGTSLDCMHCTAWENETDRTIRWMRDAHPAEHAEVFRRLLEIRRAVAEELSVIDRTLKAQNDG